MRCFIEACRRWTLVKQTHESTSVFGAQEPEGQGISPAHGRNARGCCGRSGLRIEAAAPDFAGPDRRRNAAASIVIGRGKDLRRKAGVRPDGMAAHGNAEASGRVSPAEDVR